MRQKSLVLVLVGCVSVFLIGPMGCTSLLGSFEVGANGAEAGPPGDDGGSGADACTLCNNQCVDVSTNTLNCGACGLACLGGQTCQASACKCPVGKAFCGGQCVTADRQHCGPSCSVCPSDQICSETACTLAPSPQFEVTPRDPTGWRDVAGAPITFKMKPTGAPGTAYECRTGPDATFTATVPEWKNCDGAMGKDPTHTPTPDATTPQGTYRTEYRYRSDTYKSDVATYLFYAHHKLDKVPTCPRPGKPADGPHFTDDMYFKAAQDYSVAKGGPFNTPDVFPLPGARATDPFVIRGASIRIPFAGVHLATTANIAPSPDADWGAVPAGTAFTPAPIVVKTLHHKYALNATRTLMLVKRQYINPIKGDCKDQMQFGSHKARIYGPAGLGRGPHYLDCEAFVLDVHGQALCMGSNAMGTAPVPQLIDERVDVGSNSNGCVLTGPAGATTLSAASPNGGMCFSAGYIGGYIEIPAFTGTWYRITAGASNSVGISPGLPAAVSSVKYRYNTPHKDFVVPSGFAHLLHSGHRLGPNPPSNRVTKCETIGCADPVNQPWLTYLPP